MTRTENTHDESHRIPPRPDGETGLPKPPRAPVRGEGVTPEAPIGQPHYAANPPKSPFPDEPALFCQMSSRALFYKQMAFVIVGAIIAGLLIGYLDLVYYAWPISVGTIIAGATSLRPRKIVAGASWVRWQGRAVDTYALRTVDITSGMFGTFLTLHVSRLERAVILLDDMEANRDLWDYVYNGIRHSEASGASIDDQTRSVLRLVSTRQPAQE